MALLNKSYKFPNQLQHDTMQCGVACLEMICEYYNKKYSASYLSTICRPTTEGVSMLSIRNTAYVLGFDCECGKINLDGIKNISAPLYPPLESKPLCGAV